MGCGCSGGVRRSKAFSRHSRGWFGDRFWPEAFARRSRGVREAFARRSGGVREGASKAFDSVRGVRRRSEAFGGVRGRSRAFRGVREARG